MQAALIRLRTIQISCLFACSIFLYQYLPIENSIWIPITVIAILGPFHYGLSVEKARERVIGTLVGLLASMPVTILLRYNHAIIFLVAIVLVFLIGLSVLQSYRYFIMLVTIMLCINYHYMNLPLVDFNEVFFIVNRAMAILIGVIVFYVAEYLFFKKRSQKVMAYVDVAAIDDGLKQVETVVDKLRENSGVTLDEVNAHVEYLSGVSDQLKQARENAQWNIVSQQPLFDAMAEYEKKIDRLLVLFEKWGYEITIQGRQHRGSALHSAILSDFDGVFRYTH